MLGPTDVRSHDVCRCCFGPADCGDELVEAAIAAGGRDVESFARQLHTPMRLLLVDLDPGEWVARHHAYAFFVLAKKKHWLPTAVNDARAVTVGPGVGVNILNDAPARTRLRGNRGCLCTVYTTGGVYV